jgi:DNA-binding NarL/FixJ family response regulator
MIAGVIVMLVQDLMFGSRIREAARATGAEVRTARTLDALREAAALHPSAVIVDLDKPPLDPGEVAAVVRAEAPEAKLVGFFSHVETATGRAAREQGYTQVLPRSAFVKELPQIVA